MVTVGSTGGWDIEPDEYGRFWASRHTDGAWHVDPRIRAGQAPGGAACELLEPHGDGYDVGTGDRLRALVAVKATLTRDAIAGYLTAHGWGQVRLYESSDALPPDWPKAQEGSPGLEPGQRWIRGEIVRTGKPTRVDVVSTLHALVSIHLGLYRIAQLWRCTDAAPATSAASSPAPSSWSSSTPAPPIVVYGASWCLACQHAVDYLRSKGSPFIEKQMDQDPDAIRELERKFSAAGGRPLANVIPVIDVGGILLTGFQRDAIDMAIAASKTPGSYDLGHDKGPMGLDPSISPQTAQVVLGAYLSETDPTKLRAYGDLLAASFPVASRVLLTRARDVEADEQDRAGKERKDARKTQLGAAGLAISALGVAVSAFRK